MVVRPREPRILNLDPPPHLRGAAQQLALNYLEQLNRQHLAQRSGYHDLEARIASYELAAHMQLEAKVESLLPRRVAKSQKARVINPLRRCPQEESDAVADRGGRIASHSSPERVLRMDRD